jgi:hypothetical protein
VDAALVSWCNTFLQLLFLIFMNLEKRYSVLIDF